MGLPGEGLDGRQQAQVLFHHRYQLAVGVHPGAGQGPQLPPHHLHGDKIGRQKDHRHHRDGPVQPGHHHKGAGKGEQGGQQLHQGVGDETADNRGVGTEQGKGVAGPALLVVSHRQGLQVLVEATAQPGGNALPGVADEILGGEGEQAADHHQPHPQPQQQAYIHDPLTLVHHAGGQQARHPGVGQGQQAAGQQQAQYHQQHPAVRGDVGKQGLQARCEGVVGHGVPGLANGSRPVH